MGAVVGPGVLRVAHFMLAGLLYMLREESNINGKSVKQRKKYKNRVYRRRLWCY